MSARRFRIVIRARKRCRPSLSKPVHCFFPAVLREAIDLAVSTVKCNRVHNAMSWTPTTRNSNSSYSGHRAYDNTTLLCVASSECSPHCSDFIRKVVSVPIPPRNQLGYSSREVPVSRNERSRILFQFDRNFRFGTFESLVRKVVSLRGCAPSSHRRALTSYQMTSNAENDFKHQDLSNRFNASFSSTHSVNGLVRTNRKRGRDVLDTWRDRTEVLRGAGALVTSLNAGSPAEPPKFLWGLWVYSVPSVASYYLIPKLFDE